MFFEPRHISFIANVKTRGSWGLREGNILQIVFDSDAESDHVDFSQALKDSESTETVSLHILSCFKILHIRKSLWMHLIKIAYFFCCDACSATIVYFRENLMLPPS